MTLAQIRCPLPARAALNNTHKPAEPFSDEARAFSRRHVHQVDTPPHPPYNQTTLRTSAANVAIIIVVNFHNVLIIVVIIIIIIVILIAITAIITS